MVPRHNNEASRTTAQETGNGHGAFGRAVDFNIPVFLGHRIFLCTNLPMGDDSRFALLALVNFLFYTIPQADNGRLRLYIPDYWPGERIGSGRGEDGEERKLSI